ncbi:hypothetical protein LCGC14_2532330, partial [marine sediment metagenome]
AVALYLAQSAAGATLCVRLGYSGELFFANMIRLDRVNAQETYEPTAEFAEIHYSEAV